MFKDEFLNGVSRRNALKSLASLPLLGLPIARRALAAEKPTIIRFGAPTGYGRSVVKGGVIVGVAAYKGWFDEEFKKEGIRPEFQTFKGGAPLVGQALANNQLDFAVQGDLMSVIGHSAGANTRLILPSVKFGNAYLATGKNSQINSIKELKGKKVAYFKGNFIHLQVLRILASEGMVERDLRSIYLDDAAAKTAVATGDVDAIFGGHDLLDLRDKGLANIVYSTNGHDPRLTAQSGFLVSGNFSNRYPDITQRVVNVIVKTGKWMSDPANRDEVLGLWTTDSGLRKNLVEDLKGRPFEDRVSPLIDEFFVNQYKLTLRDARKMSLLRGNDFDVDAWIDRRYVDKALADLGLQKFWSPIDKAGRRIS